MKHHKSKRKFGRVKKQRNALIRGLARSLVIHGKIQTTEAKAKELRPFVERLVTKSKAGTLTSRRLVESSIGGASAAKKLVDEIAPKYKERAGGYTRVTKLGARKGDSAPMAVIEFV